MIVEGAAASIARESPEIKETFAGQIAADGSLRLEGTGTRKENPGAGWRYRFDGRFEDDRFSAIGMMLSANLSTKLRDCTMTLDRSRAAVPPPPAVAAAEAAVPAAPPPSVQDEPRRLPKPGGAEPLERELDFTERNDSAVVEATVSRVSPHRYFLNAKKGQALAVRLKSDDGTRFDLYEPGSSLQLLSGGFVVQGARVGATPEGTQLDVELPGDGKYLLLVRSPKDVSSYTLELAVSRGASSVGQGLWWTREIVWVPAALVIGAFVLWRLVRRKRDRRLFRPD